MGDRKQKTEEEPYNVSNWGKGFFSIGSSGDVYVSPAGKDGPQASLHGIVQKILRRGVAAPILLRFDGILRARVRDLNGAFDNARREFGYTAPYRGVFPIKVNQEKHVVETLLSEGRQFGMGLEVGSKPELLAGIAVQAGEGSLLICNGYKDREYIEMALLSSQLGITAIIVIEKITELDTILESAERLGIKPRIGVRAKLAFRGTGRWQESVGDRSKFGLTSREIVAVVERLGTLGMLDCLELLHFHIGSQITQIRALKHALREASGILVGLTQAGVQVRWFDVGGGLGIDYDGSGTQSDSSMNYSLQEYANDVVWSLGETCREHDIPQPTIISESGRALCAHHAVLVSDVVGVNDQQAPATATPIDAADPDAVRHLFELRSEIERGNYKECYHDALDLREEALLLFNTGQLSLEGRARAEEYFWHACQLVLEYTRQANYVPKELSQLERDLADTYFVNFSLFQSMPDSWAIGQLFPVLPLHRHDEEPTRRAVLADLTCDSDGKLDRFIGLDEVQDTLKLHELRPEERYFLGFFLIGAYQEILGDMHNLFGDTNVVHVDLDERGVLRLNHVIRGDRVKDVLAYVEYFEDDLMRNLRRHVEASIDAGRMDYEDSALFLRRYEESLRGYTYLVNEQTATPHTSPIRSARATESPQVGE